MTRVWAFVLTLFVGLPAFPQQFPGSQPIKIVVPFAPGGTTDLLGRTVAEFLQKRMNHTIVVENRPGAAMTIGTDFVAKSAPDGHTLLLAAPDLVVVPAVRQTMPYDIEKLTYLTRVWVQTVLIVTGPKSGINTIEELITKIRNNPGQIRHATNGVGALNHLLHDMRLFKSAAELKLMQSKLEAFLDPPQQTRMPAAGFAPQWLTMTSIV